MFDNNSKAIAAATELKEWNPVIQRVEVQRFETWQWKESYDAIFLTWSAGYLKDRELVTWLKDAKLRLNNKKNAGSDSDCFIYLLDNVTDRKKAFKDNGQWNRPSAVLTEIIKKSNLKVMYESDPVTLHEDYGQQKIWVLY